MDTMDEHEKETLEYRVEHKVCPLIKIEPPKGDSSWTVPDPSAYYCGVDGSFLDTAGDCYYHRGYNKSICTTVKARKCRKYLKFQKDILLGVYQNHLSAILDSKCGGKENERRNI